MLWTAIRSEIDIISDVLAFLEKFYDGTGSPINNLMDKLLRPTY